jgi:inositol phosphorylceramide mannosyltransferase catalytic subunit
MSLRTQLTAMMRNEIWRRYMQIDWRVRRLKRALQARLHHSSIRIVRFLVMTHVQRVIGADNIDGSGRFARNQNFVPIAKEIPPEPIKGEEISRVIFQTWKSRVDIPPSFRYWRSTFMRNNPEFQCVLWDDDDNREFIAEKFAWFLPIYDGLPANIFRADAVRPFFLFLYGGLYADMDTECLRPLWTMPHSGDVILGQMGPDLNFEHSIPNAIMASRPFQLFWLLVIALMIEKVEFFRKSESLRSVRPESLTGPILLHEAFHFYRCESEQNIRLRSLMIIENLPERISTRVQVGRIELLPPDVWYPIAWTNPLHSRLRNAVLDRGMLLSPAEASSMFPKANLVTYWGHSWEQVDPSRKQLRGTAMVG